MADELTYLQSVLPSDESASKITKVNWSGLNMAQTLSTGELSDCNNVSTDDAPYLTPSCNFKKITTEEGKFNFPICVFFANYGSTEYLFSVELTSAVAPYEGYYFTIQEYSVLPNSINSGRGDSIEIAPGECTLNQLYQKILANGGLSVARFVSYAGGDITETKDESILIAPFYLNAVLRGTSTVVFSDPYIAKFKTTVGVSKVTGTGATFGYKYISTHLARLFGAVGSIVGASAYMDSGNWETNLSYLATGSTGYGAGHAWVSSLQSDNNESEGSITGMCTFGDRVIVFKRNTMYEVYNTKNPFRVRDIFAEGTIDNRSVKVVDGNLFFVSEQNVNIYTGGNPRSISEKLNINQFTKAVAGVYGRKYYLFASGAYKNGTTFTNQLFVYDTFTDSWTKSAITILHAITHEPMNIDVVYTTNSQDGTLYLLTPGNTGAIYKIDSNDYSNVSWFAETDILCNSTNGTISADPKRLKKLQFIAEIGAGSSISVYATKADDVFSESTPVLKTYTNSSSESKRIPIRLNVRMKSDYGLKIRISGVGYSKVYAMEVFYTDGGALSGTDRSGITES